MDAEVDAEPIRWTFTGRTYIVVGCWMRKEAPDSSVVNNAMNHHGEDVDRTIPRKKDEGTEDFGLDI